jgi:chorismate synthase
MLKTVESTRERGDSVGGIIECAVIGMKPGIGGPLFEGLDGCISKALFGIPAVKGVEFGAGFSASSMTGSKNNDPYYYDETGNVRTKTNNSGGITGGMSNGMPIVFRAAFKPTPSISLPQDSVDLISNENTSLEIKGRHDPCVVLRAAPIVEAIAALTVADFVID